MHPAFYFNKVKNTDINSYIDTESKRYTNDYKNQLEYLKMIVYNLDKRLSGKDQ